MEHRCGERRPVVLGVVLKCRDKPALFGEARNVSRDGMFVCVNDGYLKEHDIIEVEFTLEEKSAPRHYCMKAWVAHSSDAGAGLMFATLLTHQFQQGNISSAPGNRGNYARA
ncbi:hypothetical protein MNBD_GAMMA26-2115 [hydrothermal vent metagenome]|uniref:PilZ domain-containing protein n=1 Tax=hydrothermal vent metagenome TaxID=652676 RepID=A0A3B1BG80_9ZZZZ